MSQTNVYGDDLSYENSGKGADIASQRQDDLDKSALLFQRSLAADSRLLDLGSGRCAMANEFAKHSKYVTAVDSEDFAKYASTDVNFVQDDIIHFLSESTLKYNLVLCQRTIHYFEYSQALALLKLVRQNMLPCAKLFLSASGMSSELSRGYTAAKAPVTERFNKLSIEMQEKHGIRQEVCLYSISELTSLLSATRFRIQNSWVSEFGNVKIIADPAHDLQC